MALKFDVDTLPSDYKRRGWAWASKQIGERRAALTQAFDEAGEDRDLSRVETLSGSVAEKTAEISRLSQEIKDLELLEVEPHPGHASAGARFGRGASKGWKSGHWGTAFLKATKDLTPSGSVTVPSLVGGIVPIADRPQRLLDVIPTESLRGTDSYGYLRETKREHKAAETAPGALKPTSKYQVKKIEDTVKVIAHLSEPISRFDLEDADMLGAYVDNSMRAGCMLRLDEAVLSGTGEEGELTGLNFTENIETQAFHEDGVLTTARKALTVLEENEIYSGVFVLTPAVWEELCLLQTKDGGYILSSGPVNRAAQTLWGQSVIVTTAMNAVENESEKKVGFLADFAGSTEIWERDGVRVDWSEAPTGSVEGASAFKTNELIFRGEGRFGFGVKRPAGIVQFPTEA